MRITLIFIFLIPISVAAFIAYIYWQIPSAKEIRGCLTGTMNNVHLCPSAKTYVPLKQIAPVMRQAILLSEDSTFYQHSGFDWEAIEKSARENWKKGTYKRGGSTITQQLAKNLFLSKDKTLLRKFIEGLITVKIERTLSKNEILERYLNVIEFGKGVFGIKAAASHYFNKSPSSLTAAESAFLAMLLPNPVKYSTSFKKKELTRFAERRVTKIVKDLYQYSRIDLATYESAMAQIPILFGGPEIEMMNLSNEDTSEDVEIIESEDVINEESSLPEQSLPNPNNSDIHADPTHNQ